ncbi:homeobox protein HMX1-like [Monodelphis domestica]|uniref:homeobox protein HMX1-like n=1 Tax=Monodelphis domestica TaxID=13616 RepID=UPI0024E23A24|nr:homeobox protein HMX1-like [Monodelphis domestica]
MSPRRLHLPCVPAPVYRAQSSRGQALAAPRAPENGETPPGQLEAAGSLGPRPRRNRTVFSSSQVSTLERAFQGTRYLSAGLAAWLAQELRIPTAQVRIWFQNRRKKLKRQLEEQAPFRTPPPSNPFQALVHPVERWQPDYHTLPLLRDQQTSAHLFWRKCSDIQTHNHAVPLAMSGEASAGHVVSRPQQQQRMRIDCERLNYYSQDSSADS